MNSKVRRLASIAAASMMAAPLLASSNVLARSQAAILGHERFGSQAACFEEREGGPFQNGSGTMCNRRVQWVMPIVYDSAGMATIRVSAQGSGSGTRNVECTGFTATAAGALTTGTTVRTVRNDARTEHLTTTVMFTSFGGTWLTCGMDPGTRLFNLHY